MDYAVPCGTVPFTIETVQLRREIPSLVSDCSPATLEWGRFLDLLANFCHSPVGRAWALALAPSTDRDWLAREHTLVGEMRLLIALVALPPLNALFDPAELLAKSRIEGAALEADELRRLLDLADIIAAWTALLRTPPDALDGRLAALTAITEQLFASDLRPMVASIRAKLLPDGTLTDDASPELRRIRREMERQQRAIEDSLRSALRRLSAGGSTQDDVITIRGERFVIPVKSESKRRVQGVVHGASSSGQTVYVEPLETIELNNDLVRLLEEEQSEIHRIFLAMTRQIAAQSPLLEAGAAVLAEVETLAARARFSNQFDCVRPLFTPAAEPELRLTNARHPLLEKRLRVSGGSIVPLSLALTSHARQLIISGPNTGGKTVGLKTAGLLAIMAQSGIPVPAEEAVFPVFDAFLADIGDAQSIERDLSTFSSHIVNLNRIAQAADGSSLVLLDELGSATDPEEGAALAVAIAEHFLNAHTWSIISTHHTSLKIYAENTEGVLNAAVGFDEQTLAPTYQLRLGVPGASAGINIAARLGLAPDIITSARSRLSTQTQDIGRFLDSLHAQIEAVTAERAALKLREQEIARERLRLETEGLKEWRVKVREMEQQLASLLKDFEYQARETVKAIDDRAAQQKLSKEAERRISRLRREFSDSFNSTVVAQHTGADKNDRNAQPHIVKHVTTGDTVKLRNLGRTGIIQRLIDANTFEVAVGPMKMRIARDEIAEVIHQTPIQAARGRGITVAVAEPDANLSSEINVIGRTADEATAEVERFLDQAFLAGLPHIRIVHGTGMGVLRRTLRAWLERHPHVASVSEPAQNQGGAGATVVELRN